MKIHIVKKGESLFGLSKKYNVSLQKLIEANPQIVNPDQLNVGDKVKIPAAAVLVDGDGGNVYKHVVKQGDSLWKLAKAWGLPMQSLVQANPQLGDPNALKVGEVVNIPTTGQSTPVKPNMGQSNVNKAPVVSGSTGKKNTAPIAEKKAEQMKPKPAPAPTPAPAPVPAPSPINVEPPKPAPAVPVPIQLDINVENITYEPIKYENPPFENIKAEESPCPPKHDYPMLPNPQLYQVEQPTYIAPAPVYPPSPCGCSGAESNMDNDNLFYQYQVNAENVSSYYDFPQMPQEQVMGMQQPYDGEYPGISNAPMHQMPEYMGPCMPGYPISPYMEHPMENKHHESPWQNPYMDNFPVNEMHSNEMHSNVMHGAVHQQGYGWPIHYGPSPCCGSFPMHQHSYPHYGMMHPYTMHPYGFPQGYPNPYGIGGYEAPGMPGVSGIPVQPNVPMAPLGGFGVPEPVMYDRDAEKAETSGAIERQGSEKPNQAKAQAKVRDKGKKEAKISANTVSGKTNKKRTGSASGNSAKKDRQSNERANHHSDLQNPWINE
ncbi:morphogenetic protein associated with SpoVID [Fontibacillus phaseoli]|uniref:Morphogenetic protein associated with SpoVID n=1 Tax=Fontibacillus phaseoli TaxID=1416533 RepID=A0A369BJL4_9BACL|nr:LysM peptidoglycan-binding domain-containing protein [Fontibacillus phaseoli]RCX19884.1 morphogenetic protein associated with SpoVID [Fontibacillus phaseoli]